MSKNKIESESNNSFDGNEETDIIYIISKQKFLSILSESGFNEERLKHFFQEKRSSSIEQNKFNIVMRNIKENFGISIIEMVVFLENANSKLKKILTLLDEETTHILKHELAKKFKIKIDKNMLYKILE